MKINKRTRSRWKRSKLYLDRFRLFKCKRELPIWLSGWQQTGSYLTNRYPNLDNILPLTTVIAVPGGHDLYSRDAWPEASDTVRSWLIENTNGSFSIGTVWRRPLDKTFAVNILLNQIDDLVKMRLVFDMND